MSSLFEEITNKTRKEIEAREDEHLEILIGLMDAGFSEQDAGVAAAMQMEITRKPTFIERLDAAHEEAEAQTRAAQWAAS